MYRIFSIREAGVASSKRYGCRNHLPGYFRSWYCALFVLLLLASTHGHSGTNDQSSFGYIFKIEDLIVKPAEARKGQYVFLNVAFEVKKRKNLKDLRQQNMTLRKGIKQLIRSKTIRQLDSPGDKQRLRNEIYRLVESHLASGDLIDVYFIDYIIQTAR